MLLLAPVLLPVAVLMPDRETREAKRVERISAVCAEIVAACDAGDYAQAQDLVYRWQAISPGACGPGEAVVIMETTLSEARKLEAIARIAGWGSSD